MYRSADKKLASFVPVLLGVLILAPAWLPLLQFLPFLSDFHWLADLHLLVGLNFVGWILALFLFFLRVEIVSDIQRVANEFGIDRRLYNANGLLHELLRELRRKDEVFALNVENQRIESEQELARNLEKIVSSAYRLLRAESAELALYDSESEQYHSSFVLGKPFRSSSQAMLSDAAGGDEGIPSPDVLIRPILFAGSTLGSVRVALKRGTIPKPADKEILRLVALQGGLAIINSEYTSELMRLKRSSDESVKARTGFLANLSHEIRGPLGIMINAVELVLDGLCGEISSDQLETLKMVHSNGEHLLELINDVLDFAKVESGKMIPNPQDILVDEVLRDLSQVVRAQAEAKGHKVLFRGSDEALAISCDRRHLRQMLINLLTNAIKYTPDGGTIELWAERIRGNRVRLNVTDTGVGIKAEDRPKVFSAFERIENSYSINQLGTGLGMSLTKRLAEVNGAQIDFESREGEGSHFWFVFHAVQYDAKEERIGAEPERKIKGNGDVILLVEGDEGERNMLTRYLTHLGFIVVHASSRSEALHLLREQPVRLAIFDNETLDRPDEDLLHGMRESAQASRLPVILLSSRGFVFDIEKYLRVGVDLCLVKPVKLAKLGIICRDLIDGEADSAELEVSRSGDTWLPTDLRD